MILQNTGLEMVVDGTIHYWCAARHGTRLETPDTDTGSLTRTCETRRWVCFTSTTIHGCVRRLGRLGFAVTIGRSCVSDPPIHGQRQDLV